VAWPTEIRSDDIVLATAGIPRERLGWRMAVLPFRSVGTPVGFGIALGMAEEVSAALSRFRAPRLIATTTFWDGTGPAEDALARCRAYQLDYIIDGTIQVIDDRVEVHVSLLDVVFDFEVIWSGRFDGPLDDLFSLQHRIASETVAQVDPELFQRISASTVSARTEIAAAHQSVLTAIQSIFRLDRSSFMLARDLLTRAIELDPDYAPAHAWMAYWSIMAVGQGWVQNPRDVTTLAGTSAERAVSLDPLDARALAIAGHVKGYLLHDVPSALRLHARAIELNPNLPIAWTLSSCSKIYNGEHGTAIKHARMSQSLSPRDPQIFFVEHQLMTAHFFNRDLDEAEMLAEVVFERNPEHASALNVRLAILGHLGRRQDASECLGLLRKISPGVSVDKIVSRAPLRPDDRAFYIEGLERAGVPR
jgi:TolB-like protein/Tfp pilus assembly protein PilF